MGLLGKLFGKKSAKSDGPEGLIDELNELFVLELSF